MGISQRQRLTAKQSYCMEDLLEIMAILRSGDGCPWDKQQTHASIRKNFIEETYEVAEAIDAKDEALLQEELGDVLLQVVFHTQMEAERNVFDFGDVVTGICKKLIERHPHIFGGVVAKTPDQVLENWDDIKKRTKGQTSQAQAMQSVPKVLPALMRSQKVQHKAAKVGFDWPDVSGAIEKLEEELAELKAAVAKENTEEIGAELGDLLFSVVNVSRFVGADAEEALSFSCDKFIRRFTVVEQLAAQRGLRLAELPLSRLDMLWDEAKQMISTGTK